MLPLEGRAAGRRNEESPVRKKIVLATAAGALAVGGLAFALPAVADDETSAPASPAPESGSSAVEDRVRDALSGLVDDGSLTQEQADEVAATLSDAGTWADVWDDVRADGGWGGGWAWGGSTVVTDTLGMTEDELRTALEADGATLASVAEAQGVAVEDLVAAIAAEVREHAATAVEDGVLTQEQADEWLTDLEARITEVVQNADGDGPRGGSWGRGWGGHGWHWGGPDGD
jgi:polyhydroxyalkanoate synthesis regulator phasin